MSCGFRDGFQNNWLFTQFISKDVPTGTDYNVEITVELLYTLSSCRERYGCNPEISIYTFCTDGPQPRDVYTNTSNYELLLRKPGASALTQLLEMKFEMSPEVEGCYLAIQDNTSCIQVAQLKLYRHECGGKKEQLVVFSDIAAPMSDNMTVPVYCMPNSSPASGMDMNMTCDSTGIWGGIWGGEADCMCDAGYVRRQNADGHFCEGINSPLCVDIRHASNNTVAISSGTEL